MRGQILAIDHDAPAYWKAVELRRLVLREPLGLDFSEEELQGEHAQNHIIFCEADGIVACLSLVRSDGDRVKMRQVAVHPDRQGQGLGRELVVFSEDWARQKGFSEMYLHARDTALPFYRALGYEVIGEGFEEVSIPHHAMRKSL